MTHTETIRQRPGMYIGSTGPGGLTTLVLMAIETSLGRTNPPDAVIHVDLPADEPVCVRDNAAPLSIDEVFSQLRAERGEKFSRGPAVPSQILSIELLALCALSVRFAIDVHADGVRWRQSFSRGEPLGGVTRVGPTPHTGNTFTFRPDPDIFTQTTAVPIEPIRRRLHELAAFHPGLRFTLNDETIHHPDGLAALFAAATAGRTPVHGAPIRGTIATEEGRAEAVFWWYDGPSLLDSYANGQHTLGGEHRRGFLRALTRVLGDRPNLRAAQVARRAPMADMVRAGLVAVIAVEVADPFYGAPTRDILSNMEAFRLLDALTARLLDEESMELWAVEAHLLAATPDPKTRKP